MIDPIEMYTVSPHVLQRLTDYMYVVEKLEQKGMAWDAQIFDIPGFIIGNPPESAVKEEVLTDDTEFPEID